MPQIETWPRIPAPIRDHLIERMRDRNISLDDLKSTSRLAGDPTECPHWAVVQGLRLVQTVWRGQLP
jgi:hypothetical protein